jgi:hypothetical protein
MFIRRKRVARALVSLLVISISPLYMASLMTWSTKAQNPLAAPVPMVGRLEVHGGKHILVDGNEAESGYTILDGQTLETSDCTSATVHLLPLPLSTGAMEIGQIDLATNTKAVINYSAGKAQVRLFEGCARVGIASDIDASIGLPDGSLTRATQADTPNRKRAEICFPREERREYRPSCLAAIIFGWPTGAGVLAVAGVIAAVAIADSSCDRGDDTSLVNPAGPCL